MTSSAVVAQARRALRRAGWRVRIGDDFYFNADRKGTCLHLLPTADEPLQDGEELPAITATDEAPPEARIPPGKGIAHGLVLKVSDC